MTTSERKHGHYFKDVSHLKEIDVYRLLRLYNVIDPNIQHAIKKLLVAGGRGAGKNIETDIHESIDSLNRYLQMQAEDCNVGDDTTVVEITSVMSGIVMREAKTKPTRRVAVKALEASKGDIVVAIRMLEDGEVQ